MARKKNPSKGEQHVQLNQDRASTPSLVPKCNKNRYVDLNGGQHDLEETVEIANIRDKLYTLKIKSSFYMTMSNADLKRTYTVVKQILELDDSEYVIRKINSHTCFMEAVRQLHQVQKEGKQYMLPCCNMSFFYSVIVT